MANFDSPHAKLNRAIEQADALDRTLSPLSNLASYKTVDNETGEQIYRLDDVPPIPDSLNLVIGEILYNFRCSLDHLIWQLVLSENNIPNYQNEFPIFDNVSKYEAKKPSKLRGLSNPIISIIDSLQPCYSTGDNDYWKWLWYLQVLNNVDKHRHLLVTRRTLGKRLRVSGTDPQLTGTTGTFLAVPVEKGAVFFRTKSRLEMDVKPTINIVFGNPPSGIRKDLPITNIFGLIKASVLTVFGKLSPYIK